MAGVDAVKGEFVTRAYLTRAKVPAPTHILAIGKAAVSMFSGVPSSWRDGAKSLVITKYGHLAGLTSGPSLEVFESAHPIPDSASLAMGRRALEFVRECKGSDRLYVLVPGGVSSLIEDLHDGVTLEQLTDLSEALLSASVGIHEINRQRAKISNVKSGGLLSEFSGERVDVMVISDVPGDKVSSVGSGIAEKPAKFVPKYKQHIIGSNLVARNAAAKLAASLGLNVNQNAEILHGEIQNIAARMCQEIRNGPAGIYIYGGEPTINLPQNPGPGGRNQALALEMSRLLSGSSDVTGLIAGTDGTDGTTLAAGGYVDALVYNEESGGLHAQETASSALYLEKVGAQFVTGPTGTNVMDLAVFYKDEASWLAPFR